MRVRLRFSKLGKIRFTSHRDLARIWERALRRAGLPVAYSQGFSPRPKLHFGLALPTAAESLAEYLDIDLIPSADPDVDALPATLGPSLPQGVDIAAAAVVALGTDSLQHAVTSAHWRIQVLEGEPAPLDAAMRQVLDADELIVTRQRKGHDVTDDIRPYIISLTLADGEARGAADPPWPTNDGPELVCELGTQPRGLRPSELVAALGGGHAVGRMCRTHQWMQHDGARQEPLPAMATSAPHASARAS